MNRVALITGSSRGIGKATALRLAREGLNIIVNYNRGKDDAENVAESIKAIGRKAISVQADVSKIDDVEGMVSKVLEEFGRIDVLVNNAGIYKRVTFENLGQKEWKETMEINLNGVYNCTKAIMPIMKGRHYGRIINISSIIGAMGTAHGAHYAATKSALFGFTKSLARELAGFNITVNCIAPGAIDTDIIANDTEEQRRIREKQIPLGRVGKPEEIAGVVAFLISDDADYITGQTIHVNGGLLMP